jgi:prepilin-type N-terminal cleavage/methylation domain-containing protein
MKSRRGWTLIEMMIAVAVLGIAVGVWITDPSYIRMSARQVHLEGTVRALEMELEALAACTDRRCIESAIAHPPASTTEVTAEWSPAVVERSLRPGPDGTLEIRVRAPLGRGLGRPMEVRRLLKVPR